MISFKNFINKKILESYSNDNIIIKDFVLSLIKSKPSKAKFENYFNILDNFSEDNLLIDKKGLTKLVNDFNNAFSTYYGTYSDKKEVKNDELEIFAKKRGYNSLYKAAYDTQKDEVLSKLANLLTYSLVDSKRNIDKINSIKDNLTDEEKIWIEKYYPNLEYWKFIYDRIEEIRTILNPTKEQKEKKKLEVIKGRVNPKIKEAIDKIAEDFRVIIENKEYKSYTNLVEKLKKEHNNTLSVTDFLKLNFTYKFKIYKKENDYYILLDNYDEILKKIAFNVSKEEILTFTFKMYDKLGGFISDLNKNFTATVLAYEHVDGYLSYNNYFNDILFKFDDGSKFTIRNQIVSKFSNLGTFFYTYPTTFHNAFLPNGNKIDNPNEYTVKKAFNEYNLSHGINESTMTVADDFLILFDIFLKTKDKNKWLEVDGFKMYVRKSKRYFNNTVYECVDLATIEAEEQGTGLFTIILNKILDKYKNVNFYVENVLTDRFFNFFKKYGFVDYPLYPNCLIKIGE
jgi:hypothetical protein